MLRIYCHENNLPIESILIVYKSLIENLVGCRRRLFPWRFTKMGCPDRRFLCPLKGHLFSSVIKLCLNE